jgi:hypothetical protein
MNQKRWRRRFVKPGNGWSALAEVSIAVCGVGHGIERALDNGVDTAGYMFDLAGG